MKTHYIVLGTNDMQAAIAFYDQLFDGTGFQQIPSPPRMTYWINQDFAFAIAQPFNEEPATHGNGTMIGFQVGSRDEVKRLYDKALALKGRCEGEPGERGPYYSAYVRDLDNNKLCLFE